VTNSRQKGARGERELASKLREHGFEARRGVQYSGANGDADVVGLPGVHIEVKRVERFDLYGSLSQSKSDARHGELPVVMHRKNNCEWVVVQPLDDWLEMYKDYVPF
jgi:Holliday junction resolvase